MNSYDGKTCNDKKYRKILITLIAIMSLILIIICVTFKIQKNIFEKEVVNKLTTEIEQYDSKANFNYDFRYYNDEMCVVLKAKDEYTLDNYSMGGGVRINKKTGKAEMYGINQLEDIEEKILYDITDTYYIKNILRYTYWLNLF